MFSELSRHAFCTRRMRQAFRLDPLSLIGGYYYQRHEKNSLPVFWSSFICNFLEEEERLRNQSLYQSSETRPQIKLQYDFAALMQGLWIFGIDHAKCQSPIVPSRFLDQFVCEI